MGTPKEVQEKFVEQIDEAIQSWFNDFVEFDKENQAEGLLTEKEVYARLEVLQECTEFMKRIFSKLSTGVDLHEIEEQ